MRQECIELGSVGIRSQSNQMDIRVEQAAEQFCIRIRILGIHIRGHVIPDKVIYIDYKPLCTITPRNIREGIIQVLSLRNLHCNVSQ